MDFLANTAVRVAIAAVGTIAVAAGSYLIGKQHGMIEAQAKCVQIIADTYEEITQKDEKK